MSATGPAFDVRPAVAAALAAGAAVVALESSVLAQGLPWPDNLEAARGAENAVRDAGALPATIGVIEGRIRIGLSAAEQERFARNESKRIVKTAARDLGSVLARRGDAATTVSSSLFCAARTGIEVLATGGIGGVHRGAAESFDISGDLIELGRTPIAVVCAGAKAILDLGKTRELLETLGVAVLGYGTDEWPAFYCRGSGLPVDERVDDPAAAAAVIRARRALGLPGATLVCVPPPPDSALGHVELEGWIAGALAAAASDGVSGKAVTPYLLDWIVKRSQGRALTANVALYAQNAGIAGELAVALAAGGPVV
ncbi:MAG: pseudouridine-5'-phosphate glycosidase [Gammaproteobacteria bacterium]|nr:pseudouridine-5'-phosphate glycosidase [Gammaproteobacteria bacterium]